MSVGGVRYETNEVLNRLRLPLRAAHPTSCGIEIGKPNTIGIAIDLNIGPFQVSVDESCGVELADIVDAAFEKSIRNHALEAATIGGCNLTDIVTFRQDSATKVAITLAGSAGVNEIAERFRNWYVRRD